MYHIKETIIVEGVYDKIKLARFLDAAVIPVHGFQIYKNDDAIQTIKKMAEETGIVILTDSDSAGFKIRNYIKQYISPKMVKHAYIPDIRGKERRKREPGREGLLGVEGIDEETILKSLKDAGCEINGAAEDGKKGRKITKADMYFLSLSGRDGSSERRIRLCKMLKIPMHLSANMLLDLLNRLVTYEELCQIAQSLDEEL